MVPDRPFDDFVARAMILLKHSTKMEVGVAKPCELGDTFKENATLGCQNL